MTGKLRLAFAALAVALGACAPASHETGRAQPVHVASSSAATDPAVDAALGAARRFLDHHLDSDGRIVRHDHDGDTVSEGQAYGMLLAVAIGDRAAFESIWRWTRSHLQRDDGLLSWRWDGGAVVDAMAATDADLDAAHALTLAAERFDDPSLAHAARRLARAIVAHEVVDGRLGPVAVAGPWAASGRWVNPSYGAPAAFAALAELTADPIWDALDDGARRVAVDSATASDLPPDWAVLTSSAIEPRGSPSVGGDPVHGYDAARTSVRFAVDCDPEGRAIAARLVDEYEAADVGGGVPAAVLSLDGTARVDHGHPVMTVARAAALAAAGDVAAADRTLALADRQAREWPSYYGEAWVALGRLWLTTDLLGGCRRT